MASSSSLRSDLNRLNGQVNDLNNDIKKLKKRRTDVEAAKKALATTVNNNTSDVNNKMRSAANKLNAAIDYSGKDSLLNAILTGKDERTLGSDNDLTFADWNFQRELNDIERRLGDAERDLSNAKRRVADTKVAILIEEKRERDEAAIRAAQATANTLKK